MLQKVYSPILFGPGALTPCGQLGVSACIAGVAGALRFFQEPFHQPPKILGRGGSVSRHPVLELASIFRAKPLIRRRPRAVVTDEIAAENRLTAVMG